MLVAQSHSRPRIEDPDFWRCMVGKENRARTPAVQSLPFVDCDMLPRTTGARGIAARNVATDMVAVQ